MTRTKNPKVVNPADIGTRRLLLDASSTIIGWVCDHDGVFIGHGTVLLQGAFNERLSQIPHQICALLTEWEPDVVVLERPGGSFQGTVIPQVRASGVILWSCLISGTRWGEVSAKEAKKALTGNGNANKQDMVEAARKHIDGEYSEHVADAIGIALAWRHKHGHV